jgi:energy-coupling factor transporter ATP-binding protein EcfA2
MAASYWAFGLRLESPFEWLPLRSSSQMPSAEEVVITLGNVPDSLDDGAVRSFRIEARRGQLLFRTRTIANFLVETGNLPGGASRITVSPHPESRPWAIANILLGAVSGAALVQRAMPALHGCAVEVDGRAVIICGTSGAGKSTLAMLLHRRGCRILDDNIATLRRAVEGWLVLPGSGFLRLTGDTLAHLQVAPSGPAFPAPSVVKHIHVLSNEAWCREPRPLAQVHLLDRTRPVLRTPMAGPTKADFIRRHWFFGHAIHGLGMSPEAFEAAVDLAGHIPMAVLGHPPTLTMDQWADAVLAVLQNPTVQQGI